MSEEIRIRKLVSGIKRGDLAGQKEFFRKYYSYVMSICLRYTRNAQDAEEVLNDTFVKIFSRIETFNHDKPINNWIATIAVNASIDQLRRQKNLMPMDDLDDEYHHHLCEMPILNESLDERILPIIQSLPPQYRLVFNMYVFEDYKHEEIAVKLGISVGTSKSNYSRARKILKDRLSQSPHYKMILKNAI